MNKPHIVILGAGYGGLMTAIRLQKMMHVNEADITLVNNNDYHYQTSSLHENAAGTLKSEQTVIPIRDVINQDKIDFILDEVVSIKETEKKVKLSKQEISYDILVVSLGFEANITPEIQTNEQVFPIANLNNARFLREHLEYNIAKYANETNKNKARLNIVIVGGGMTGIGFAGELVNRLPELSEEYDVDKMLMRIINIENDATILTGWQDDVVNYAMNSLESRGVEFIMNASFLEAKENKVIYERNNQQFEIPAMTTVWAGGVHANKLLLKSGLPVHDGKVEVTKTLQLPDNDSVYVIGDCARITDPTTNVPYNANARLAVQAAMTAADNIKAQINGNELVEFKMKDRASIASLGVDDGVAPIARGKYWIGWKAIFLKRMIENHYLFKLGGLNLLMKKGRLSLFHD